jgi:polyisoprenoid-binding protein YceI
MATTTWNLDTTHTDVIFAAKHMMVTTVRGKFATVSGSLQLDPENPTAAIGSFIIDAASLNTGVEQRDGHLRSPDFFDVQNFPEISFISTSVTPKGDDDYAVTGDLTIRGTTKPVTLDVEYLGLFSSMGGARRAGFHATTKINREDWGLTWNVGLEAGGWLVGKDVKLEIDLAIEEATAVVAEPEVVAVAA